MKEKIRVSYADSYVRKAYMRRLILFAAFDIAARCRSSIFRAPHYHAVTPRHAVAAIITLPPETTRCRRRPPDTGTARQSRRFSAYYFVISMTSFSCLPIARLSPSRRLYLRLIRLFAVVTTNI